MSEAPRTVVVCAMASEARALVDHWRLPPRRALPFKIYDDGQRSVVVSGVGCVASATAVGYMAAHLPVSRWFNFGLAGHASLPLGTPLLADRVGHQARDDAWYPVPIPALRCIREAVLTHDDVVFAYPAMGCCDMEASAFMAAASRVGHEDRAQVLKVVSDNTTAGPGTLDRARIETLAAAALPTLLECMALQAAEPPPMPEEALAPLLGRWRFSHAQQAQLRLLWRRRPWSPTDIAAGCDAFPHAADVLAWLRARLETRPA